MTELNVQGEQQQTGQEEMGPMGDETTGLKEVSKNAGVRRLPKLIKGDGSSLGEIFKKMAFVMLVLIILLAGLSLFFTLQDLIETWVRGPYVPMAMSVYYLLVIVGAVFIINRYILGKG